MAVSQCTTDVPNYNQVESIQQISKTSYKRTRHNIHVHVYEHVFWSATTCTDFIRLASYLAVTYNVGDVMVDVLKEAVSLGEGGATVLDEIKCPQLSERREKLLHLRRQRHQC